MESKILLILLSLRIVFSFEITSEFLFCEQTNSLANYKFENGAFAKNDDFFKTGANNNFDIIYTDEQKFYKTICNKIEMVQFPEHVSRCTRNFYVTFGSNTTSKTRGFLNKQGIIRSTDITIECKEILEFFRIETYSHIINITRFRDYIQLTGVDSKTSHDQEKANFLFKNENLKFLLVFVILMAFILTITVAIYFIKRKLNRSKPNHHNDQVDSNRKCSKSQAKSAAINKKNQASSIYVVDELGKNKQTAANNLEALAEICSQIYSIEQPRRYMTRSRNK